MSGANGTLGQGPADFALAEGEQGQRGCSSPSGKEILVTTFPRVSFEDSLHPRLYRFVALGDRDAVIYFQWN